MTEAELKTFRDRLELPIPDERLTDDLPPYVHPGFESDEYQYLMACRQRLGGSMPARRDRPRPVALPGEAPYPALRPGPGDRGAAKPAPAGEKPGEVVSLDSFRKK